MNIITQKALIIEQFKQVNDINLINAIKNILDYALNKSDNKDEIPEQHKKIVRQRLKKMELNPKSCLTWEQIERKIKF